MHKWKKKVIVSASVLVAIFLAGLGVVLLCVYWQPTMTHFSRGFSRSGFQSIHPGMSADEVRELIGYPILTAPLLDITPYSSAVSGTVHQYSKPLIPQAPFWKVAVVYDLQQRVHRCTITSDEEGQIYWFSQGYPPKKTKAFDLLK